MNYSRGEIVWVRFPFSDATTTKLRPALIISNEQVNRTGDYPLVQVTSRLRNDNLSLAISEKDFTGTPLLKQSEIRLHKIFILHESLIESGITNVSARYMKRVVSEILKLVQ